MENKNQKTSLKFTLKTVIWILKTIYRFSPTLIVSVFVIQIIASVAPFIEQRYLSNLIDSLIESIAKNTSVWVNVLVVFVSIRIVKMFLINLQRVFQNILETRTNHSLRKFYLDKTSSLDYQQFEDPKIATLMAKVNEEYGWRSRQIVSDIFSMTVQIISFATVIVLLLPRYWMIVILSLLGELPSLIIDKKWQEKRWHIFNHYNEKSRPGWDAAWQLVDKKYVAELKISRSVEWLKSKFIDIQQEWNDVQVENTKNKYLPDMSASLISQAVSVFCMVIIVKDIKSGVLTVGMFTFYFSIIRNLGDYFAGILNLFISIGEQSLHINNFRTIIELPKIITDGQQSLQKNVSPLIEFKNVSFRYPSTDRYIYKNLNLVIKPGEEIAIVGPNGAGKSTLIKLLCRFYDPTEGQILINGIDLTKYQLKDWYDHISLLTQEFNVYPNLSLEENVSIGSQTTKNSVLQALKKSEAYSFTAKYTQGLKTMMSQRYKGEEPSWGQWQKIAIARIFHRDTPVMILDEPTASIDAVAESKIFSRLYKQIKQKTLIIISHRFSTVRNAKRIIVIDKGKIIETGSHAKLLKKKGIYYKSFKLQAEGYN